MKGTAIRITFNNLPKYLKDILIDYRTNENLDDVELNKLVLKYLTWQSKYNSIFHKELFYSIKSYYHDDITLFLKEFSYLMYRIDNKNQFLDPVYTLESGYSIDVDALFKLEVMVKDINRFFRVEVKSESYIN
jgi:hypothetical protein